MVATSRMKTFWDKPLLKYQILYLWEHFKTNMAEISWLGRKLFELVWDAFVVNTWKNAIIRRFIKVGQYMYKNVLFQNFDGYTFLNSHITSLSHFSSSDENLLFWITNYCMDYNEPNFAHIRKMLISKKCISIFFFLNAIFIEIFRIL